MHLAFLIAALNDLEILSADVQNAFLNSPTKEKIYTIMGPEFSEGKEGWSVMTYGLCTVCGQATRGGLAI
jgi:hypothetical protein